MVERGLITIICVKKVIGNFNMQKLLVIVTLGLLWCSLGIADEDLKGKKLFCQNEYYQMSFEFTYFSKVKWIDVNKIKLNKGFKEYKSNYTTTIGHIIINTDMKNYGNMMINRRNLKLNYLQCEIVKKNVNLKTKMKKIYDKLVEDAKSKNKI